MCNLFSLTTAMENGWVIKGVKDELTIRKGEGIIKFDERIKTSQGTTFGIKIMPREKKI